MRKHVICLPGGIAPAAQRFASLLAAVGGRAELHMNDLEVYRGGKPPTDYSVEMELEAVDRFADVLGLDRFHLLGYSAGGFIALAYAGTRPERLLSLGLFEPAMVPGELADEERTYIHLLQETLRGLEGAEFMSTFLHAQLKPGVEFPEMRGPLPPAMQNRPAGLVAFMQAFLAYEFDRGRFRDCRLPVYLGYGDLTSDMEVVKARVLAGLFGDIRIQRYAGIHHFVAPELIYTHDHAQALEEVWARGSAAEPALQQ